MQVPNIRIEDAPCEEVLVALLENFISNFEEARRDRVFQQLMISAPPVSTGSTLADAVIAATAEHLAISYGLRVPAWANDEWRAASLLHAQHRRSWARQLAMSGALEPLAATGS
ncbi:hypothetical protein [Rhizobium leguminosarum]|uniref:hypothetical protein n=1 Tax=Rhizobium leguminosarum TaxID=384 RepID=UPI002E0D7BAC|nr:hypothetical protein U8Q02_41925 [Rhizobium leguminosarum]